MTEAKVGGRGKSGFKFPLKNMWVGEPDYMEASWGNVKQANQNIPAASTAHSSFFYIIKCTINWTALDHGTNIRMLDFVAP